MKYSRPLIFPGEVWPGGGGALIRPFVYLSPGSAHLRGYDDIPDIPSAYVISKIQTRGHEKCSA